MYPPIAALLDVSFDVDLDQCMYGLSPPHVKKDSNVRIKKSTRLRTNVEGLKVLRKTCDRCSDPHSHYQCLGSVKVNGRSVSVAKSAGAYPPRLCAAWAAAVTGQIRHDGCC